MELENIDLLIGNVMKLRLLLTMSYNEEKTLLEIKNLMKKEFQIQINRETIYRAIESMLGSGFIVKSYNISKKGITYKLVIERVLIDIKHSKILTSVENS